MRRITKAAIFHVMGLCALVGAGGCGNDAPVGGAALVGSESAADTVVPDNQACQRIQYHGGHVLDHVKIQNIFWGSYWNKGGASLRGQVDQAWSVIGNNRAFYSALLQYGNYFQQPGVGQYLGAVTNNTDPPANVYDSDVQSMLQVVMQFGLVPPNTDSNLLYVVYLPPGIVSHPDLENSWGGHHTSFTRYANNLPVYYATIVGSTTLDTLTLLSSHEVDEAIADPAGNGWDEVGDPCQNLNPRGYRFNGYWVERVYSDADCGCVSTVAKPFNSRHDILWRDTVTGDVGLWQMNGSASVRTFGTPARAVALAWQIVGTGDFDGDGEGDILWRNTDTGQNGVWLMRGENVVNWNGVANIASRLSNPIVAGVGDFDGDGFADILWRDATTGAVDVEILGAQWGGQTAIMNVPLNWQVAGIGDFDGDHKSDVLWRDKNTGDVGIWMMNGGNVRSYEYPGRGVSSVWRIYGVGDFDGDGKSDILWRNLFGGDVGIWLMNGGQVPSYQTPATSIPFNWTIMTTGDLDGDGKDDIVWRDSNTGDVGAWLMNGGTARTMDTPARAIPAEWKIVGTTADQT
jgi:VCBS repeat protein